MLKVCDECGTRYAPDLEACPHCGSEDFLWNYEADAPVAEAPVVVAKAGK